jgi:hypothetical protein
LSRIFKTTHFEVKLLTTSGLVLYCSAKENIAVMPETDSIVENDEGSLDLQASPIPESKSGTILARVIMNNWSALRLELQF